MFYKKVNLNSNKECFDFLTNHFTYDTLNSWNGVHSIANNVKVYRLGVNMTDALDALQRDDYLSINESIHDWEDEHPGYKVAFNGRSSGYLVLYNDENMKHCFSSDYNSPCNFDDYDSWKESVKEDYGSLKNYHYELVEQVKVVQDFDKLCDDLIDVLKGLIEDMHEERRHTHKWKATKRHEHYVYDTLLDLKYHKEWMLQHRARIFDENDEELYIEYEVDNFLEGEVVVESDDVIEQ